MANNKVVFGGNVLIDLTADTVESSSLLSGVTAHHKSGAVITGECTYDADTSDASANASNILDGKTAYVAGAMVTGSMANNGAVSGTISTKAGQYTVPVGFHDGSGKVGISSTEQANIIAGNIKQGVTILGVQGSYSGASCVAQAKEVTPSASQQVVQPDSGYTHLTQVTVKAIPYVEQSNAQGGTTVTIG